VDHYSTASPNPRAIPARWHHLLLCFEPDGGVSFYPRTADPPKLARRLARLVRFLVEEPGLIRCAAHGGPSIDPHLED
jgi:hypothetical protein